MDNKNNTPESRIAPTNPRPVSTAVMAGRRGAILVLRAGSLEYRDHPSMAGGQRIPYKSGRHLGAE